ncbi:MAG: LamG domain-containing protein, partial [Planctomycetes bacterium]|nr:LamG domain-containing protein [Planctomycetota bacterium]
MDIESQLLAYWNMNEGQSNFALDASGSGFDAQLMSSPQWVASDRAYALSFDGSASYVNAGDHSELRLTSDMSVSVWVRISDADYNSNMRIISKKYNWDDVAGYELEYNPYLNQLTFNGGAADNAYATNVDLDTQWHLLSLTVSESTVQFYVDGLAINADDNTVAALQAGTAPLHFARNSSGFAAFVGELDELRLYSRALSPEDIAALYADTGLDRYIWWSNHPWLVKDNVSENPGPNAWSNSTDCVWVDAQDQLHLQVKHLGGQWKCAEI